jgi:hypothetical protein
MSDPDSEFQIRDPKQLREMAEFYGNRPCVELGKTPTTREISQGECADLSVALGGAADEINKLRSVLDATHKLISEGALRGFVPTDGTWADRLFKNQWNISQALKQR